MIHNIKQSIKCCAKIAAQNIGSWAQNYRMIMLLLLLCASVSQFCSELNALSSSVGTQTNVLGVLPNMYSNFRSYFRVIIQLGIVLMFSNAPFKNGSSLFCVMRTGYVKWCVGELLYIVAASFIYTVSLFLLTNIFCLNSFGYSLGWGKTFSSLRMSSGFPYPMYTKIQIQYKPLEALLHTMLLIFLLSVMFGLLIFLLSSLFGRSSGLFVTAALVLLGLMPDFCSIPAKIAKLSPCSLTHLGLVDKTGISAYPSLRYAYITLGILIAVLFSANILVYSNKRIRHYIYASEV